MAHAGVLVQFELDLAHGDAALACKRCPRPGAPDSKRRAGLPPRRHPPLACGLTLFGSANPYRDVAALAARHGAGLVVLLRINHVAHAVSAYRHFRRAGRARADGLGEEAPGGAVEEVPWGAEELARAVEESRQVGGGGLSGVVHCESLFAGFWTILRVRGRSHRNRDRGQVK